MVYSDIAYIPGGSSFISQFDQYCKKNNIPFKKVEVEILNYGAKKPVKRKLKYYDPKKMKEFLEFKLQKEYPKWNTPTWISKKDMFFQILDEFIEKEKNEEIIST